MDAAEFHRSITANPINATVLQRLPALDLADAWLVSGALFQTVWNTMTDRPHGHGIADYDVFYFDPDTSWAAEDAVIRRAAAVFADCDAKIEVRNQARVPIWFPQKYGDPYPPLDNSCQAIERFLSPVCMVGVQPGGAVYAPRGFDDIANMVVRPNLSVANFHPDRYHAKAARWQACWPEITVVAA